MIGERTVGGEPDRQILAPEGDVVAAERAVLDRLAIVAGRTDADGDAGQPGDGLDDADQLRRPEDAAR